MRRLELLVFGAILANFRAQSVKVDMGTCSCNCATDGSTLSSHFIGGPTIPQSGKFYESIRGLKGEMGRPGDVGQAGTSGTLGSPGLQGPPADATSKQQQSKSMTSCADLKSTAGATSGIYKIKPRGSSKEMQVFCETSDAGGGWTLVASIHENNINGKCTAGDNWSDDRGISLPTNFTTKRVSNWENFNTFGHPEAATSADYKNAAYYTLTGDDVMVWHVPNDSEMSQWGTVATLKYYTNNQFLSNYGGTLQALYSKYYPMKKQSGETSSAETVADRLEASSRELRNLVPGFYAYSYDDPSNTMISDGGNDMYDTGNKVFYKIGNSSSKQITYGQTYTDFDAGVQVYSRKMHPFITYMWIPNENRDVTTFEIKVVSGTGADNNGYQDDDSNVVTVGNLTCKYEAYHVYGAATDPSICEVYFYCYSEQLWNSVRARNFTRTDWRNTTDNLNHGVLLDGSPRSVLLGYTLLSRGSAVKVTNSQIQQVLRRMMADFRTVTTFPGIDCLQINSSLAVPIEYITGDNDAIMNDIPPMQKQYVEAGYLHFRPIDIEGRPSALCPGIKSMTCNPEYVCVGGIGVDSTEPAEAKRACGDFAGWQGRLRDNATATQSSGSARPLNNLETTLLIFTR